MTTEPSPTADRPDPELMIVCESSTGRTILGPDPVAFQRWEQQRDASKANPEDDGTERTQKDGKTDVQEDGA